jgi:uncharacterized membrane protein YeiH
MSLLNIIEIFGIAFFTVTGAIEAKRRGMDLVGVFVIAFITAFGGGTLRDVILNRYPLFWIAKPEYIVGTLILSIATSLVMKFRHIKLSDRAIIVPDAVGLGLYSAVGVAYTIQTGVSFPVAILMGVITATFGGVLRDIVFKRGQLYATCAFASSIVYFLVRTATGDHISATAASVMTATILRIFSVKYDITLPL